jgi:hypothetical protein
MYLWCLEWYDGVIACCWSSGPKTSLPTFKEMKVLNPGDDMLRDAIKKTGAKLVTQMCLVCLWILCRINLQFHPPNVIFYTYHVWLRSEVTVICQKDPLAPSVSASFACFMGGVCHAPNLTGSNEWLNGICTWTSGVSLCLCLSFKPRYVASHKYFFSGGRKGLLIPYKLLDRNKVLEYHDFHDIYIYNNILINNKHYYYLYQFVEESYKIKTH